MATAIQETVELGDDTLYELIDGRRVEKLMGIRQTLLANHLAFLLNQVAYGPRLGFAVVEPLIDLGNPALPQYRPDVAYVSEERWPRDRQVPSTNAWAVVPDLAVEVVSPSNSADEIQTKVDIYLKAGVRLVWVVYLKTPAVHVYDGTSSFRILSIDGELDGGAVIPDFRLPLFSLFANEAV